MTLNDIEFTDAEQEVIRLMGEMGKAARMRRERLWREALLAFPPSSSLPAPSLAFPPLFPNPAPFPNSNSSAVGSPFLAGSAGFNEGLRLLAMKECSF